MSTKASEFANPAPLGLMGFGMTTILLNLHNAGLFGMNGMILAMGIFYGGIAQIIAGIMEFRKGNTFGTTAFTSYGLFWLSLVYLILLPLDKPNFAPDNAAMAAYLFMWGLFTLHDVLRDTEDQPSASNGVHVARNTLLPPRDGSLRPCNSTHSWN